MAGQLTASSRIGSLA